MAHNPQAPQGPEGNYDPAGSTQMFRAFVDDGVPQGAQPAAPQQQAGPRIGLIVAVVAVIVVLIGVAALAI
ncbi:hypothetical protein [Streptomyces sp. NBC_00344]|uniref:hypothetical protein n=1 Tax=Streptomyces sp. NBC_00344 TaxID=2975720 RepID=UPI002E23FB8D